MTHPEVDHVRLADELASRIACHQPLDSALDELLRATQSRATGVWKLEGDRLLLVGFRGAPDMPADVKEQFAAATRAVPLDQTGLGIVKAVLTPAPAIAEREGNDLAASGGWLARFGAQRSLAVPFESAGRIAGVIAVSTTKSLDRRGAACTLLTDIADRLSKRQQLL